MVRYLPAQLLRDLNIVDTPGTNVILERQQRLTEEYVPRADMVLFTMSAGEVSSSQSCCLLPCMRVFAPCNVLQFACGFRVG